MNAWINLSALWKIVVIGLLAGAGLPALFAVGLRALSPVPVRTDASGQAPDRQTAGETTGGGPLWIAAAVVCFTVVLAAIGWGIYSIVDHS